MTHRDERRLLAAAGVLRHPCDLDLLLFFARHPRVLLASESLASFLGYDMKVIAQSLDGLLAAGLLTRRQAATHAARLYVFTGGGVAAEWLPELLQIASTREGRRTLRTMLNAGTGVQGPDERRNNSKYGRAGKTGPRPVESPQRRTAARRDAEGARGRGERGDHDDS
jgi:hypothetical protein